MKRIIIITLVLLLVILQTIPTLAASADNEIVSPMYNYLLRTSAYITINESTSVAQCNAACLSASGYAVKVECKLQRYMGSFWGTVKTWTASGSQMANASGSWAVPSGYTYRVYATFRVYDSAGNLLESDVITDTYSFY